MRKESIIMAAVIIALFAILAIVVLVSNSNQKRDCSLISDQDSREDCHHSLAHQTNNKAICDLIQNSEKKEHCLGHVPGD